MLNILAYSDMSSLFTQPTTYNPIPLIVTYILFQVLFILILSFNICRLYIPSTFLSCLVDLPVCTPVPGIVGCKEFPVTTLTLPSSNSPIHDPTPRDRLFSFSIHYTICDLNSNFPSVVTHLATSLPNLLLLSETAVKSPTITFTVVFILKVVSVLIVT